MEEFDEELAVKISNRNCVRQHRVRRKNVGLKEIRVWVRESDVQRIFSLLHPFLKVANNILHSSDGGRWDKQKISAKDKLVLGE